MRAAVLSPPGYHRLHMHTGDFGFDKLGLRIGFLSRAAHRAQRAVPASLEVPREAVFLKMNFREPLHVGDAIPAGHNKPHRETLLARQRFAIERIG